MWAHKSYKTVSDKTKHSFMMKKYFSKLVSEGLIFNLENGVYIIPIANMILNGVAKVSLCYQELQKDDYYHPWY